MIHVEHTVEIDRPPAEVFDYMMDMANLPEWQSSAIEAHWEGERAAGSHIVEVRKFLGKRIESEVEVTEYEPNRRFCLKALSGPVPFSVSASTTGRPIRSASENPVSSNTPRPDASTRPCLSHVTRPVLGAG